MDEEYNLSLLRSHLRSEHICTFSVPFRWTITLYYYYYYFIFFLASKDFITKSTLPQMLRWGVTKPTQGKDKQTSNPNRNNTKRQPTTITQEESISVSQKAELQHWRSPSSQVFAHPYSSPKDFDNYPDFFKNNFFILFKYLYSFNSFILNSMISIPNIYNSTHITTNHS